MKLYRMLPYVRQGTVIETGVYCYFNYNYYVLQTFCSCGRLLLIIHMTVTVKAYLNPSVLLVTLFIHQNLDTPLPVSLF